MHEINPNAKYPDLEWLSRVFNQIRIKCHEANTLYLDDATINVFPQTWANTGGGLAEPGYCYGAAMTTQLTTVIHSDSDGVAMVCFGNQPAYFVDGIFGVFYNDLDKRNMCGMKDYHYYIADGGRIMRLFGGDGDD